MLLSFTIQYATGVTACGEKGFATELQFEKDHFKTHFRRTYNCKDRVTILKIHLPFLIKLSSDPCKCNQDQLMTANDRLVIQPAQMNEMRLSGVSGRDGMCPMPLVP